MHVISLFISCLSVGFLLLYNPNAHVGMKYCDLVVSIYEYVKTETSSSTSSGKKGNEDYIIAESEHRYYLLRSAPA